MASTQLAIGSSHAIQVFNGAFDYEPNNYEASTDQPAHSKGSCNNGKRGSCSLSVSVMLLVHVEVRHH